MFAFSYSRIGVVRRHLTRAAHASNVVRAPEASDLLRAEGDRIHIFWLSGFIFFGSSNGVFEQIREAAGGSGPQRYVILDATGVTGFDTSAVIAFVKLRNWTREHRVTLAWAGLPPALRKAFDATGLLAGELRGAFATRIEALEWCEERLLEEAHVGPAKAEGSPFAAWLTHELGEEPAKRLVDGYLERRMLGINEVLYSQGQASDTIDLIASGCVAVTIRDPDGRDVPVRRMAGQTVVGEMGFFRRLPRTASVVAESASVVYVMTRERYEALMREKPELGALFVQFIVRALSDRIEFANKEISALL